MINLILASVTFPMSMVHLSSPSASL